jgi:hypothetical protein
MSLLGVHVTLLIGPTLPVPAPLSLTEALDDIRVTQSDAGRSGFEINFMAGRGGPAAVLEYPLLGLGLLEPFNRVILLVTFGLHTEVLIDGIITRRQLAVGHEPGEGRITITGEDVSVMMDLEEVSRPQPAMDAVTIAGEIVGNYPQYGLSLVAPVAPMSPPPTMPT